MFTFLRKIRQSLIESGRVRKYLLYAIGEIFLVMIGILLALQVNNWNTERIERGKAKGYALSLIQDLEDNRNTAVSRKKGMDAINIRIDSLRNYVRDKRIEEISNLDMLCLSWRTQYPSFSWRRSTFEELKSSEGFRLIKNDSLLNLIVAYDAFTHHLDEDYSKDIKRSDLIAEELSKIVNTNYPNILDQEVNIFLDTDRGAFDFFTSPEYREAKAFAMSLLTDDIEDIHRMINRLIAHKSAYDIRSVEMKTMTEDIDVILSLLKREYVE